MAGKGRGVASFTFSLDALGIGRGNMPEARVGPSPLFPTTDFKPVPLKVGEEEDYMLALKQEMRGAMRRFPYHIKAHSSRVGEEQICRNRNGGEMNAVCLERMMQHLGKLEKYTQRYLKQSQMKDEEWTPDWNLFPKELMPRKKRVCPKTGPKKKIKLSKKENQDILNKLEDLEKKDSNPDKSDEETEKKAENEEEEVEEEEYDEEEIEEENDYIDSYFDNGEDFGAGSDDNMDGEATY